jgi:hypothetical protein
MIMEYGPAQIPGHRSYRVEGCDHFNVCKPPDQDHPSYDMLLQFLEGCRKVIIVVQLTNIGVSISQSWIYWFVNVYVD